MDLTTVRNKLTSGICEVINSSSNLDVCVLPGNRILTGHYSALTIYDENLNEIIKIDKIEDKILDNYGLALSQNNFIYASSVTNNCIWKLNMELKLVKSFGSKGTNNESLWVPTGICCFGDSLYICDCNNKRIQILDLDLNYISTMGLDYCPHTIKVSSETIGICGYNETINFYDLITKNLTKRYAGILGRISAVESNFYVTSWKPSWRVYSFNNKGEKDHEIDMDRFKRYEFFQNTAGWDGLVFSFNKNLYITSYTKQKLLKF